VKEVDRRRDQPFVPGGARRFRDTVRMAHVQVDVDNNRLLLQDRLYDSLAYYHGYEDADEVSSWFKSQSECLIWGDIPEKWVVDVWQFH
jgi:hypothetical protein